jgi:hypothetical protein
MGGVFINYRTGDGDWAATFIARELAAKFGAENVFFASKSIRVGEDFVVRILDRLRQCDVFLAVIGPRWLTATGRTGEPRLNDPQDWVRREVIEAFTSGLRVIPVFLDGTPPLNGTDLPDDIAMLARCQYLRLHHRNDDRDIARVIDELTGIMAELDTPVNMVAEFKKALAERGSTVREIIQDVTGQTLDALGEARYPVAMPVMPERQVAAALAERLSSYADDMDTLLRLAAFGVATREADYDELWVRAVERMLNRVGRRTSTRGGPWIAAESYPALLLSYVIGIAGTASGRDEVAYLPLARAKIAATGVPAIEALALRNVVDPKYAANFPEWNGIHHYHALSRHLRIALRPVFDDLLDDHEYTAAFEEYEYLRSLLELHDMAFSSLGEFAFQMAKGRSAVGKRMAGRLGDGCGVLRAGAFGGVVGGVTAARHQLGAALEGRYR